MAVDEEIDEQYRPDIHGRHHWGFPNRRKDGSLRQASNCRACVHWRQSGYIQDTQAYAAGCAIHASISFPDIKDCPTYLREVGADDE